MIPHSHKEHKQHAFDCYCKKILKYAARDYYRKKNKIAEWEIGMNQLYGKNRLVLAVKDEYFEDAFRYHVQGFTVTVSDEILAQALDALPDDRREVVLLSYLLDMSDREIAQRLNLARRTVTYRRSRSLLELKARMEELDNG